jgi:hypothetical protein
VCNGACASHTIIFLNNGNVICCDLLLEPGCGDAKV